jgi:uncharacterized protein YbjT (DUF2867 family)
VRDSGLEWTILRPGGFYSNTFAWAGMIRAQRRVTAPFAGVGLPFVDPADVAGAAAAILRGGSHAGRAYELTGPTSPSTSWASQPPPNSGSARTRM